MALVRGERSGRERLWAIEGGKLEEARRCLDEISQEWDVRLGRLQELVER